MAVDFVGIQSTDHLNRIFTFNNHDFSVSSALKRTGHARFRRGPTPSSSSDSHAPSTSTQSAPVFMASNECSVSKSVTDTTTTSSRSTNSSSLISSPLTAGEEGSVSNGRQFHSSLGIVAPAPAFSSRKPPLPSSHRKRCRADRPSVSLQGSGSGSEKHSGCHCCKRRKIASKREVRRVPITGSKVASIPADDFSWKKYGEKKIDGSPYPRVYYKCSTGKGCPARKRVEVAMDDSKMLLVSYDGDHIHHHHHHHQAPTPILTGLTGLVAQSK